MRSLWFVSSQGTIPREHCWAYGDYAGLAADPPVRPAALTRELYRQRAQMAQRNLDSFPGTRPADRAIAQREATKQVFGLSELDKLPYFNVPEDSLFDMMHITSGVVGRHTVMLLKGSRGNRAAIEKATTKLQTLLKSYLARDDDLSFAIAEELAKRRHDKLHSSELLSPAEARRLRQDGQAWDKVKRAKTLLDQLNAEADHDELEIPSAQVPAAIRELELAYTKIQAPFNIAPASLSPFSRTGDMTAHHWVNFAKVYGKALLSYHFKRHDKRSGSVTVCNMLNLVEVCLRSNVTAAAKVWMDQLVVEVARNYEKDWPITEHAIITHLLVFHMPDIIRRWGPSRGYWCFPFERMIGKLGSTIKSKRHPETNLVNRYLLNVATRTFRATSSDSDYDALHPLIIPPHLVHSNVDSHCVLWPQKTKKNSQRTQRHMTNLDHVRERHYIPILGPAVLAAHPRLSPQFELVFYRISLQVGRWTYSSRAKEDGLQVGKSRSSWFRIRSEHVPHFDADALVDHVDTVELRLTRDLQFGARRARPHRRNLRSLKEMANTPFVYGRVLNFATLTISGWKTFHLARVELFLSAAFATWAHGLVTLDLGYDQLHFRPGGPGSFRKPIEYVQAQYLDAPIGLAPVHLDASEAEAAGEPYHQLVLPIDP